MKNENSYKNGENSELLISDKLEIESNISLSEKKSKLGSFFNKLFFKWTKSAMNYSNTSSLKIVDLKKEYKENIMKSLCDKLYNIYYSDKKKDEQTKRKKSKCYLLTIIIKSNLFNVSFVVILALLLSIVKVLHITLQKKLITLFSETQNNYLILPLCSSLFLLNKLIQIFLTHHSMYRSQIVGTESGNMLLSLVYEKLLRTAVFIQNKANEGQILNFIQSDIETLGFVFFYAPMTLSVPFQFISYIIILFKFFGSSFIFGFILLIFLFFIAIIIQRLYIKNQRNLLKTKDKRMKVTSSTFNILKVLKMFSWEEFFINKIEKARESELIAMKKIQNATVLSGLIHWSIPTLLSICSIGVFSLLKNKLKIENLITAIEIFDSLSVPLYRLPIFITAMLNCLISMKRLEDFLNERDIEYSSTTKPELLEKENIVIKFSNCNFGIKKFQNKVDKVLLKDINLEIKQGELVAILGENGSGKTCLGESIINILEQLYNPKCENEGLKSENIINGTISYAPQNPWILNESIKNNILFYNQYDEERYKDILSICQLNKDLKILPGGDFTEVSSNGTNISGGQKARISLARAVYKKADIYIFDDPLASLDSIVSTNIFKEVLLKFLSDKTRLIIRHDMQNLRDMDKIIYMDKGKISWIGNYDDFCQTELYKNYSSLVIKKNIENVYTIRNRKKSGYNLKGGEVTEEIDLKIKMKKGKLIVDEKMEKGGITKDLYLSFIKTIGGYCYLIALIILSFINQSSKILGNLWLVNWSSKKINNLYAFLIYSEICIFNLFFLFLKEFVLSRSQIRVNRTLHKQMLKNIIYAPINLFHDVVPIGQCINRLTLDLDKCKIVLKLFNIILISSSCLICSVILCANYNKYSLLSAPIIIIMGIYYTKSSINAGRDLNRIDGISRSPIITCFSESMSGFNTIRSFEVQKHFKKRFFSLINDYYIVNLFKFGLNNWYTLHLELSSFCYACFIVIFSCIFKNSFTSQAIGLLLKYSMSLCEHMVSSFNMYSSLEKEMVSFERCNSYTKLVQEKNMVLPNDSNKKNWPVYGKIQFSHYYAKYRPENETSLIDINITINEGEKIGIVGRTGSGKSTLTLSLLRILEPLQGTIYIDGVDICSLGLKKLRENLCIVPQDPTLVEGTIRENLDPLQLYSDKEINLVLDQLQFFEIMNSNRSITITNGLYFKVDDLGTNLSLGEKQLLCFARSLLKRSRIIILDEATASLDKKTENIIQNIIDKQFKTCTVISIVHRIQSVLNFDKVIVMDNGKVAEYDDPQSLLKKRGKFAELYYDSLKGMKQNLE